MKTESRSFANLILIFVTFVWGATFSLTKTALAAVPVFPFLTARFIIAGGILVLLCILSPSARRAVNLRTVWLGTVLGLFLYGVYACQTLGLISTSPAKAGFLTGMFVLFVPLFGVPFLKARPTLKTWSGAILATAGLGCLCGINVTHIARGDLLVLCCAVFLSWQILFIEKFGGETHSLTLATVEIVVLSLCCAATGFIIPSTASPTPWSWSVWTRPDVSMALIICSVFGTSLAYWAQNAFQKFTSPAQAALIFSLEPVFGALIAWVALHDTLGWLSAVGCLLIFVGTLVAEPNFRWNFLRRKITPSV